MTSKFIPYEQRFGDHSRANALTGTALVGLRPEPASGLDHSMTIDFRGECR